jgi:alpha-N-arabinofuranosidase
MHRSTHAAAKVASAHAYYENVRDLQSFLVSSTHMDSVISEVCVKARRRSDKTMYISFDEWNVWYQSRLSSQLSTTTWDKAPRLSEDDYTVADAVVVGNLLVSLLRRSDRVKMACLAQLVNTIGTIRAESGERAWRQTSFYPFSRTARHARGATLVTKVISPQVATDKHGSVDALDAIATVDDEAGEASFFLVNRSATDALTTRLDLRGFGAFEVIEHVVLSDDDPLRTNNATDPTAVAPVTSFGWRTTDSTVETELPPASWSVLRLRLL